MLFNFLTTEWEQDHIVDEEQDENKQIANMQQQRPHIIIAGSSLVPTEIVKRKFEEFSALPKENVIAPTIELDTLISQLSRAGTVTLLPGTEDPTNCFLPQKPLHHLLLPNSYKYSSFIPATNPHSELVNNMLIVGSSGQNLADIVRFSEYDHISALEMLLQWNHLCPSAPDFTPSYPFND
ncbi:MAG: putative DNA polymerase delta small subunit, partial [Streblomastix strix]